MDKVIVTVLLIIGGIVASFAIINGVYPALSRSSDAISSAASQVNNQIESQIEIINVSNNGTTVELWVKNTGSADIGSIENSDVFLSSAGNTDQIVYDASSTASYWNYRLTENNTIWGPTVTNEITIYLTSPLPAGTYQVKVVIPNGISDQATFGG